MCTEFVIRRMFSLVLIVDFSTFSYKLTRFLKPQTQINKIFIDFEESISLINQNLYSPDFIIINISNIDQRINDLRFLKTVYPNACPIVITNDYHKNLIGKLIENGIKGVFHENDPVFFKDEFFNLLSHVKNNGSYVSQQFTYQMFEHIESKTTVNEKIRLTDRQNQIINFLISGDTYNDIAHKMDVSVNTTRKHIAILYKKLNVKNRSSLFKIKMHNLIEFN